MELRETYLVKNKTSKKTPTQLAAITGCMASIIPNNVATPLPPLNCAKTGKTCPSTADKPIL